MEIPFIFQSIDLVTKIIALYDAPSDTKFKDVIEVTPNKKNCIFQFYNDWQEVKTLKLTKTSYGCGGCGTWLFGQSSRTKEGLIDFLFETEKLRHSRILMAEFANKAKTYSPKFDAIFIGELDERFNEYVKTITIFANPDQVSILQHAFNYYFGGDENPFIIEFGSGCMQMLNIIEKYDTPKAILGGLDFASRGYIPRNYFAITMNKEMYDLISKIDENSFLTTSFFKSFKKMRQGSLS
ncbi:MAG: DUF169 domain-containing protein [bacterium]